MSMAPAVFAALVPPGTDLPVPIARLSCKETRRMFALTVSHTHAASDDCTSLAIADKQVPVASVASLPLSPGRIVDLLRQSRGLQLERIVTIVTIARHG